MVWPMSLPLRKVHLWFVRHGELNDYALLEQYRGLLSQNERMQEKKFHFDRDQLILTGYQDSEFGGMLAKVV